MNVKDAARQIANMVVNTMESIATQDAFDWKRDSYANAFEPVLLDLIQFREKKAFEAAKRIKFNGTVCSPDAFCKFDDYVKSEEYLKDE